MKSLLAGVLVSMVPAVAGAAAFNITFEFETPEGQGLWSVEAGAYSAYIPGGGGVEATPQYLATGFQIAGSVSEGWNLDRTGTLKLTTEIDAPAGFAFTDFSAQANIWSMQGWGSWAYIRLSADGVNFTAMQTPAVGNNQAFPVVTVAQVSPYDELEKIWLQLELIDGGGYTPAGSPTSRARIQNIQFNSELVVVPEPVSGVLLLAATGMLMRRWRH